MRMSVKSNSSSDNLLKNEDVSDLDPPVTNEEIVQQAEEHCVASFATINQMRQNSQLCDVTLEVGGETLHAHKVILASVSPYFHAMFNNDMLEHTLGIVRLGDIDVVTFKHLIDYIYTGKMTITEQNVRDLIPASSLLQMHSAREACCKFMVRQLLPSNCLSIRSFAHTQSCKELHTKSHNYALENFQQVAETEEFLLLSYEEVRELISNNLLNVCSEEKVFHAVVNWIKHDLDERQKHIAELLSHVRLPLVHRDFLLSSVETETLIRNDNQCINLLMEAMKCLLCPEQRCLMATQRTQERRPYGMKPYIFAIGGNNGTILNECEVYNPRSNTWYTIAPMSTRRECSGVTALYKKLYAVGGTDGSHVLNTVECYNPATNKWSYTTPMGTKRTAMGICTLNGLMYVCGGSDGESELSSAECYDPLTSKWTSIPDLNNSISYCRSAVLDNCVYICGGLSDGTFLSNVERFDPRVGCWDSVPSMTSPRAGLGVASCDSCLYCIGGKDDNMRLSSGERFNLRRNCWEPIAAMHSIRSIHEVVEVEGSLYALGGTDTLSGLNSVERYDINFNAWFNVSSMTEIRNSIGAAVVDYFQLERGLVSSSNT